MNKIKRCMTKTKNLKTEEELIKECKRLARIDANKMDLETTAEARSILSMLYRKWYTKLKD